MKTSLTLSLTLLCILSACTKRPPPPPAVLPGVEVGGTIEIRKPEVRPVRVSKQPYENIYFAFDVDTLRPGQIRNLKTLAKWAQKYGKTIHVTGYADTVGTEDYNMALSLRRAEAVAQHLPGASVEDKGETTQFGDDDRNRKVTMEVR